MTATVTNSHPGRHMRAVTSALSGAPFMLRAQVRDRLLRAVRALEDERLSDDDALAIARNVTSAAQKDIELILRSPALRPSRAA